MIKPDYIEEGGKNVGKNYFIIFDQRLVVNPPLTIATTIMKSKTN